MTLYFAYGSNMDRALMRSHCPGAVALGRAVLDHHRFIIMADGYASIVPRPGVTVHGVLWRVTARDLAALNIYESVATGLYRSVTLPVRADGRSIASLVYIGRTPTEGRPKPGYLDLVVAAAEDWDLPKDYIGTLARWAAPSPAPRRVAGEGS